MSEKQNKPKRMERVQKAQAVFVAFTIVQILIFIFYPQINEQVMVGVEGPPDFASLRLIGIKEIGLMSMYIAGILTNDRRMAFITIVGRLTTIIVLPYVMIKHNTPATVLGGIPQDVIGAMATLYFLVKDRHKAGPRVTKLYIADQVKHIPKNLLLFAGFWEIVWGFNLFTDPLHVPLTPRPVFGEPVALNLVLFGYMTTLVGFYQSCLALIPDVDASLYLAAAFHHCVFYFGLKYVLPIVTGKEWFAPKEHAYFALALFAAIGLARAFEGGPRPDEEIFEEPETNDGHRAKID